MPVQGVVRFSKRQEDVLQTYWTSQVRHAGHVILAGNENIHNISDEFEIGQIGPRTAELAALERMKKSHRLIMGKTMSSHFLRYF